MNVDDYLPEVLAVEAELARQLAKFGEQNHPSFGGPRLPDRRARYHVPTAEWARSSCDAKFRHGVGTWGDIAIEEIAEAFEEPEHSDELRTELIQCAAVFVAWAASVRRNAPAEVASP